MNPIDDLNQLGYTSSAPDFDMAPVDEPKPKDEAEISTLEQVAYLLSDRKKYYNSNESLHFGEELTIENQLLVNKKVLFHLQELESLVVGTVKKVREKQNERR